VKFLFFENYIQNVEGTNTLLVPQPKSRRRPVSPGPHGCCAYGCVRGSHKLEVHRPSS